jgi:predicted peptidase
MLGSMTAAPLLTPRTGLARWIESLPVGLHAGQREPTPPLAPGSPQSAERIALIDAFRQKSAGIEETFEARAHTSDWTMPYRLFRPGASGRLPLVVYLHGSGGLGTDNAKQMGLGNVFGTRLWALPENQKDNPCYVVVPQTDRGWVRYAPVRAGDTESRVLPGLGDGARLVLEIIDALRRELPIDERRIYLTGQSMGGSGVWHLTAQRPRLFAAAVVCCGSVATDDAAASIETPLWSFHGHADTTVPVSVSRDRIEAMRKAGGHPHYTEYAGVGHNVWQWAYTEPALVRWVFSKRRVA